MAVAKLIVTKARGGSKITLVGSSGTELLSSKVFKEARGKGATVRALKGLLGEGVVVDDQTATTRSVAAVEVAKPAVSITARTTKARGGTKAPARRRTRTS